MEHQGQTRERLRDVQAAGIDLVLGAGAERPVDLDQVPVLQELTDLLDRLEVVLGDLAVHGRPRVLGAAGPDLGDVAGAPELGGPFVGPGHRPELLSGGVLEDLPCLRWKLLYACLD